MTCANKERRHSHLGQWEIDADGNYKGRHWIQPVHHTIGTAYGWIVKKYQLTENLIEHFSKIRTAVHGDVALAKRVAKNRLLPPSVFEDFAMEDLWQQTKLTVRLLLLMCRSAYLFNIVQYATLCYLIAALHWRKTRSIYFHH